VRKTSAFYLIRVSYSKQGTFGVLLDEDIPFCVTLERPWLNNKRNISCIPSGSYLCKRITSSKFGETFKISDVPGRSHILFHKGNISEDTHGCIILGEEFGFLKNEVAVLSSGRAFQEFMGRAKSDFQLEIKGEN